MRRCTRFVCSMIRAICATAAALPQDRFDETESMPTERFRAAAVNVSEFVYLFGGRDINGTLVSAHANICRVPPTENSIEG